MTKNIPHNFLKLKVVFIAVVIIASFFQVTPTHAYYTNMSASVVVGQSDFGSNSANQGGSAAANTLSSPRYAMIADGKLLVVDGGNSRVLVWNKVPTQNNTPADVVIGQNTFSGATSLGCLANGMSPLDAGIAYANGKLFIVDAGRNRVLAYNGIPTVNGASANYVLGQSSFTACVSNQGGTAGANTLSAATQIATDGQRLAIADSTNNRVLLFNSIPTTSNASADVVVGQSSFSGVSSGLTATTMNSPRGVAFFNGKLIVGERTSFRITIFNSIPTSNGAAADVVLGQSNFTTASTSPPSTASTVHPFFIATDSKGRLYSSDRNGSRYLIWNQIPSTNNAYANIVIGQPDFTQTTSNNGGVSAASSSTAKGIFATDTQMVIADPENNRVLIFNNILSGPQLSTETPELISNGVMKMNGSVRLGERGKYTLGNITVSVNGSGYSQATKISAGVDAGNQNTDYAFSHEFEPWTENNGTREQWLTDNSGMTNSKGYSLKFLATNVNGEQDTLFYFGPFNLKSISSSVLPVFSFSVNSAQWDMLSNNIDSYEIHTKKTGSEWSTYIDGIPANSAQTNTDLLTTYDKENGTITVQSKTKSLPAGSYTVQVVAKDRWGHTTSRTNEMSFVSTGVALSSNKPNLKVTGSWFPLQINKISGTKADIISSFRPLSLFSYKSSTTTPVFSGIAFSNAQVYLQVTDIKTGKSRQYETIALNSAWKISPTLFPSSLVDVWVVDSAGHYNELPSISMQVL